MQASYPRKFLGDSAWVEFGSEEKAEVTRAILRSPDELIVEFSHNDWLYTVPLQRSDKADFRCEWTARQGSSTDSGIATCRLYTSEEDMLLFGTWVEGGTNFAWSLKLDEVEHFPDEG